MLKTLTVWNFALLEHVEINFDAGLNILTGETGAGKSILIDALGAVLGHRLSADVIRTGCDWLRVEAIFDISGEKRLHALLAEQAIDDEDDTLIVTRQIATKGKNVILVNGCHVTLSVLRAIGEFLVDIHGQHENLALTRSDNQFALLDGSDEGIPGLRASYAEAYRAWRDAAEALEETRSSANVSADRMDMLRWQAQEIGEANLQPHEDEELEAEINRLSNAERITENLGEADALLSGGGESEGILSEVGALQRRLAALRQFDKAFDDAAPMLEDAVCQLKEISYTVQNYRDSMDFDPERLDALQSRMDVIDKLERKYGASIEAVLVYRDEIEKEIESAENFDGRVAALEKKCAETEAEAKRRASLLTGRREKAAGALSAAIVEQLSALGMPDAKLSVVLSPSELSVRGADEIDLLFSANTGETEKPLSKVASGGELSRIALAVKAVAAAGDSVAQSMVFDEIDTGIGGRTAQMVAERIALVAARKQVLCITHLPQIACMADIHYYLEKSAKDGKTSTDVRALPPGERAKEIARMASGADATAASLTNAKEMIARAAETKKRLRAGRET
ncbi:MAG: DNA repair protein RecN [Schwartzia sp.]|nr:DNA repair protein RecN [Schwartzia sp. (in: firmicutes)]